MKTIFNSRPESVSAMNHFVASKGSAAAWPDALAGDDQEWAW